MEQNTLTQIESLETIEAGDVLVVERKVEVVADHVEVTEVKTCGFSGLKEPQTDGEIEWGSDLTDLLAEALGDNSPLADNFAVYVVDNPSDGGSVGEDEQRDAVECDGEIIADGDELEGADGDVVTVSAVRASNDNGHVIPTIEYEKDGELQTSLTSLVFKNLGGKIKRVA